MPVIRPYSHVATAPRAPVAGGANGMGAEYCRQIAATGIDLVILDRDEPALRATATSCGRRPERSTS